MNYKKIESKKHPGTFMAVPIFDEEFTSHIHGDNQTGFCIACGAEQDGCEPDARKYECESCGENRVYGLEELLLMGFIITTPDNEGPGVS